MRSRFISSSLSLVFPVIDFLIIYVCIWFSYRFYYLLSIGQRVIYPDVQFFTFTAGATLITVLIMVALDVYKKESSLLNIEETKNVIKAATFSFITVGIIVVLLKLPVSRYLMVFSLVTVTLALVVEKTYLYIFLARIKPIRGLHKKILIYGAGELGQSLYRAIMNSPRLRIVPAGFIDDDPARKDLAFSHSGFSASEGIKVVGTLQDVPALKDRLDIEEVWIALPGINEDLLFSIMDTLKKHDIKVSFVPDLCRFFLHQVKIRTVGDIPVVEEDTASQLLYLRVKRALELVASLLSVAALTPLFILIAFLIKRDSEGPVFFLQDRVGKDGKVFKIWKFRTMVADAEPYSVNPHTTDDERITKIGRFLRGKSLDELPQLFNVIKGDMSLVGPRPEMPFIVAKYTEIHKERLKMTPGITGLWQLSGDRSKMIHENMDYDLYYLKNMSFFLDVAILLKTLLFFGRGI